MTDIHTFSRRPNDSRSSSRRDLLKATAVGVAGFWIAGQGVHVAHAADEQSAATPADEKVRLGIIGVSGRAEGNLNEEDNAIANQDVRAICDTDENNLAKAAKRFPNAKTYRDFRKLLEEQKDLDGVVISTADHCHAPAT
jgi:hypothetical protein